MDEWEERKKERETKNEKEKKKEVEEEKELERWRRREKTRQREKAGEGKMNKHAWEIGREREKRKGRKRKENVCANNYVALWFCPTWGSNVNLDGTLDEIILNLTIRVKLTNSCSSGAKLAIL